MTGPSADEAEILAIEARFNAAWNRHDVAGLVESLADDVQFVTVHGVWKKRRDEYRALIARLHGAGGPFRASMRETLAIELRMLEPDVAMVHARFRVSGERDGGTVRPPRDGISIRVVQRRGGRWLTVAVQNTDIAAGPG